MADFLRFEKWREDRRERFLAQFVSPEEISKCLNLKLAYLALVGLLCNLFTWVVWLKDLFPQRVWGSFQWYVLTPFLIQECIVAFEGLMIYIMNRHLDRNWKYYTFVRSFVGSFSYSVFFSSLIYFYKEMPIFWLFAVCPMLMSAFYRKNTWFVTTLVFTALSIIMITMGYVEIGTYRLENVPPLMMATESVVIAIIVGSFTVSLHSRIEQVIKDVAKAEATQQAKDAFFAKMSHEIRTPINAVLGMDEMILRENVSPEVESYAENIKTAGQSLLSLVNDILDTSRLETGHLELSPAEYELMSVINDCYNLVKVRAIEKGLDLKVSNDPTIPKLLYGDEVRVRQIVANILTNAVKYTRVGSILFKIDWERRSENEMDLIISISDTGIGISEQGREHLFESFERLDEQRNRYIEGTGLGLSISKQLVDMMGGEISVESEIDVGSTFTIRIPQGIVSNIPLGDFYARISLNSKTESKYREKFTATSARVLVVDDVQLNIEVFRGLLKKTKIQIDAALSGEAALALIKKNHYDIIFMDHLMPGMDGIKTLEKMKEMEHDNHNTPVIVLTANVNADSDDIYKALGFTEFVPKPVKGKVLEEVVFRYLKNFDDNVQKEETQIIETLEEDFVSKLPFLDTEMGLSCAGNDSELYKDILAAYINEDLRERLQSMYKEQNWTEYKVVVHAIKSASLSIGAMALSDEAKHLENCISELDLESVLNGHEKLYVDYSEMLSKVSSALA